jgi:hypothetical protein
MSFPSNYTSYSYAGGLVGYQAKGAITNCCSMSSVTSRFLNGQHSYAGGLVAHQENGTITNCYSMGSVTSSTYAGGLVAYQYSGTITNCYSTGSVTSSTFAKGLIVYKSGTVTGCFWDTETSGQMTSAGGTGKTTAQMKTLLTFTSSGWDFTNETANGTSNIWRMCVDDVDYPRLNWEFIDGDFACPDGVNIEDLDYFVGQWLLTNCTADNNYCGGADMDTSGQVDLADLAIFAQHWLEGM